MSFLTFRNRQQNWDCHGYYLWGFTFYSPDWRNCILVLQKTQKTKGLLTNHWTTWWPILTNQDTPPKSKFFAWHKVNKMPHKRMKIFFYFGGSLCICDKNEEPPNLKFCIMQGEQDVMQEGENIFYFGGSLPMWNKNDTPQTWNFCLTQGEQDVMQENENIFFFIVGRVCACNGQHYKISNQNKLFF